MEKFIKIGIITTAHGIAGDVNVKALTDYPQRFKKTKTVYIDRQLHTIERAHVTAERLQLHIAGINDRNAAERMRGKYIEVPNSATVQLPENHYYIHELIGCAVYEDEVLLGTISNVIVTGSNDVYVVDGANGQTLIPALKSVVRAIDVESKRIEVRQLPEY